MSLFSRLRGPRIGTKLMLLSLVLLALPWFSYRQFLEMERLLVQGQSQAQLLTAQGISTLFNGREDLFNDLPVTIEDYESLFAHPLENSIRLDGRYDDWDDPDAERLLAFGPAPGSDGSFHLSLGERAGNLYAFVKVDDPQIVYRDPDYLRLDNADHLRLSFIRPDGEDGRMSLVPDQSGTITAYAMDENWSFAAPGAPEPRVLGVLVPTEVGWNMEFRLPLDLLGSSRYFGVAVADVDDPETRQLAHFEQTLPKAGKESFNLVVLRSPEVLNIIQSLGYSGARILVIDAQHRVRAEMGAEVKPRPPNDKGALFSWIRGLFEAIRPFVHRVTTLEPLPTEPTGTAAISASAEDIISASLDGQPIAQRRLVNDELETIMAAHPIVSRDAIIGTVVVQQNVDDILSFQRAALEQVVLYSIAILLAVLIALLGFAGRLAWRIRRLRREANQAIDQHGRLKTSALRSEVDCGDEIGDLARSISNMLSKLHQHNNFLENMPRTLRHEINNPLNTLSTSLQNLAQASAEVQDSKYLASAKNGVIRIGSIVQTLADAASLDESLQAEELEIIDIQELLKSYIANCAPSHGGCEFIYYGVDEPVYAVVSDYRIEQLLDKIIGNAVDFHRPHTPITVVLDTKRDCLRITVANRGQILPPNSDKALFDSMVSHREPGNRLHFGLGLYVVRMIAEHHGGHARALNLTDGSGVAVMVELPLAAPSSARLEQAAARAAICANEQEQPVQASEYRAAS